MPVTSANTCYSRTGNFNSPVHPCVAILGVYLEACLYIDSWIHWINIIKLWPYHLISCAFVMLTEERHCHGDNKVRPVWLPDRHCAPGRPEAPKATGRFSFVFFFFFKLFHVNHQIWSFGSSSQVLFPCWQPGGAVNILDWKLWFGQQGLSVGCLQHLIASYSKQ